MGTWEKEQIVEQLYLEMQQDSSSGDIVNLILPVMQLSVGERGVGRYVTKKSSCYTYIR